MSSSETSYRRKHQNKHKKEKAGLKKPLLFLFLCLNRSEIVAGVVIKYQNNPSMDLETSCSRS